MGGKEEVLEAKLDILIEDFQRFRDDQEKMNKEIQNHSSEENAVQAAIKSTQEWHTLIGGFILSVLAYHIMKHGL